VRQYKSTKTGKLYPSVTTVLPDFPWGNEEARDRGTQVHKACYLINHGALDWDSLDPRIEPYVRGYDLLLKETDLSVELSELTVLSDKYKTAGTVDIIGKMGGHNIIADIKTGEYSQKLPSWEVQVAAYDRLYKEMIGEKRERKRYAFVLNREGNYRIFELTEPDAWTVFLSYLRVHNWQRRWEK